MTEEQKELFKDLCPRLVHGVKCQVINPDYQLKGDGHGFYKEGYVFELSLSEMEETEFEHEKWFLPIYRPLDDLTNPITQDGKTFVPAEVLFPIQHDFEKDCGITSTDYVEQYFGDMHSDLGHISLEVIEQLLEWHFDIRGLIEKGLAINVNDLKEDCYA